MSENRKFLIVFFGKLFEMYFLLDLHPVVGVLPHQVSLLSQQGLHIGGGTGKTS